MIEIDEYSTPWEVACAIIGATRKGKFLGEIETPVFEIEDIKRIGEHLLHYAEVEEGGE